MHAWPKQWHVTNPPISKAAEAERGAMAKYETHMLSNKVCSSLSQLASKPPYQPSQMHMHSGEKGCILPDSPHVQADMNNTRANYSVLSHWDSVREGLCLEVWTDVRKGKTYIRIKYFDESEDRCET